MNRFHTVLKDINARLTLQQPLKSHILLEIAGDLEDLYRHHLESGVSEEDAVRLATEKCDVSDQALESLVRVHQSIPEKFSQAVRSRLQSWWEKALFLISLTFVVVITITEVMTMRIFENASLFVWPILIIAGFIVLQGALIAYILYIRKNPDIRKMQRGVQSLLVLGVISLMIGITGYGAELFLAHNSLLYIGPLFILLLHEGRPDFVEALHQIPIWYIKGASLMMVSLCVTAMGGVLWHVLLNKLRSIEQNDLAMLLDG